MMADNAVNTPKKEKKTGFWQGVRQEWGKIIWPSRSKVIKATIVVVIVAVILGILISVIDAGAVRLLNLIIG